MSFKDEDKNIIGPSKEMREYMDWVINRRPKLDPEKMEAQLRRFKKYNESKEYQEELRRAAADWPKFVEDWHKQYGGKQHGS